MRDDGDDGRFQREKNNLSFPSFSFLFRLPLPSFELEFLSLRKRERKRALKLSLFFFSRSSSRSWWSLSGYLLLSRTRNRRWTVSGKRKGEEKEREQREGQRIGGPKTRHFAFFRCSSRRRLFCSPCSSSSSTCSWTRPVAPSRSPPRQVARAEEKSVETHKSISSPSTIFFHPLRHGDNNASFASPASGAASASAASPRARARRGT